MDRCVKCQEHNDNCSCFEWTVAEVAEIQRIVSEWGWSGSYHTAPPINWRVEGF